MSNLNIDNQTLETVKNLPKDKQKEFKEYLLSNSSLVTSLTEVQKEILMGLEFEELFEFIRNNLEKRAKKENNRKLTTDEKVQRARKSFYEYVCLMAPELIPEGFILGRHIKLICNELQEVYESIPENNYDLRKRKAKRLQLFLPPGGMKSLLASVLFPSWCYGKRPTIRFIGVGNSSNFAIENFGRPIRDIMETAEYSLIFPKTMIRFDVRGAQSWKTTAGGTYIAAGAGMSIAGRRAHISICDDVLSEQTAESVTERTKITKWYLPGLQSRLLKGGAEIIINTRWHLEDLSGVRIKNDGAIYGIDPEKDAQTLKKFPRPWKIISIPAELDKFSAEMLNKACPEYKPLIAGDSFWPELWPIEELMEKKNTGDMTKATWAALYLQNPIPSEGSIIKEKDIMWWEEGKEAPRCEYVVASLDTAYSKSEHADFSAFTVWGIFSTRMDDYRGKPFKKYNALCLAGRRGRWSFGELNEQVRDIQNRFNPDIYIIEQKASGQTLIEEMRLQGFPVHPYLPDRDKEVRAHASSLLFENGSIWFPKGRPWVDEIVQELIAFPNAPHDDFVDTITQAVIWLRNSWFLKSEHNIFQEPEEDSSVYKSTKRGTYWSGAKHTSTSN